jgi:hypothetical protein
VDNPEISWAVSSVYFGLVIGFFAGYAAALSCHTFVVDPRQMITTS